MQSIVATCIAATCNRMPHAIALLLVAIALLLVANALLLVASALLPLALPYLSVFPPFFLPYFIKPPSRFPFPLSFLASYHSAKYHPLFFAAQRLGWLIGSSVIWL
jgi:hypothetical protein